MKKNKEDDVIERLKKMDVEAERDMRKLIASWDNEPTSEEPISPIPYSSVPVKLWPGIPSGFSPIPEYKRK